MKITILMVMTYILWCIQKLTKPCKYFQLNSRFFNQRRGIFSKIAIDERIPERWRLGQFYDDGVQQPSAFPVFVKPEWGQNAHGIIRATDQASLDQARTTYSPRIRYLIQEAASEAREFEIFSIRSGQNLNEFAVFTVTEAVNSMEATPINSIYNENTRYVDVTDRFDNDARETIWTYLEQIGRFNISRMSVRADSEAELVNGNFHVIEINLFLPMPINLLDQRYSRSDIFRLVKQYMRSLAMITRFRDRQIPDKPVFTKIMLYNRQSKLLTFLRDRL